MSVSKGNKSGIFVSWIGWTCLLI